MKKSKQVTVAQPTSPVNNDTTRFILDSSKEYAIYTAQNRAIPSSCDGLKDGQRKMLWLMRNKSEKVKTISLAGSSIQEGLFLHGDASAAETISRLAAPYLNNVCLLEGIGAFGTRVGPDSWGAPRYTYVKRGKISEALLYPDMDIVPLKPNYDGSVMEPENFLPLVPLALLNGVSGIAVGWSTEILPHSLKALAQATLAVLDNAPLPALLPSYDYLNVTVKDLGNSSYEFAGRVEMEGSTVIRVVELPPDLSLEKFKARLNTMEDEGSINTYIDRSTKIINIEVRFKRGVIDKWREEDAIQFLKLKSKTTQRIVALDFDNKSIRQYVDAEQYVRAFVEWRLAWYSKRYQKYIDDLTHELNFACAVKACVEGKLPQFLPQAKTRADVLREIKMICSKLTLTDEQLDRLVSFPSYRWAQDSIEKIIRDIDSLSQRIVDYEQILNSPRKLRDSYKKDVQALLKTAGV